MLLVALPLGCDAYQLPPGVGSPPNYELVWQSAAKGLTRTAFDDSCVYVMDVEHTVSAMRKADGSIKWRRPLTYPSPPGLIAGFGMAVTPGRVIVGDIDVFGLDPATGEILWRFAPPLLRERTGHGHLTTDGKTVYAGSVWGNLYAIDPLTGTARWTTPVARDSFFVNDPVVFGTAVYVGLSMNSGQFEGGAAAVNAADGRLLWSVLMPPNPRFPTGAGAPGVTNDLVVIASSDGTVYGLDRATGTRVRTIPVDSLLVAGESIGEKDFRVRAFGNTVYIGTSAGRIVALDGSTLAFKWKVDLGHVTIFDISADDARVYLPLGNYGLVALNANTGSEAWRVPFRDLLDPKTELPETLVSAPSIATDKVFIGGSLGTYAFKRK
jgi:outer membrane protein assembly factor BamB